MAKNDKPAANAGANQGGAAQRAQEQNDAPTNSAESIAGLEVSSTQDGFRRAGFAWSKEPTFVALSDLTDEQIEQLYGEPMLTVRDAERKPDDMIARASK